MIQASGQITIDTHTPIVITEKYSIAIFDNEEAGLWVYCDHTTKTKEWLLKKLKKGGWDVPLTLVDSYVDIGFDSTSGERLYADLGTVIKNRSKKVNIITEKQFKEQNLPSKKILVAKYNYGNESWNDYTIIDELSCGANKLCLSNDSILKHKPYGQKQIGLQLNGIALIVNCHEEGVGVSDYFVKPAKVVCHPVHELISWNEEKRKFATSVFRTFNEEIWAGLQKGHVFVHCLAGIHRASSVVVSHFLWRYYTLGHQLPHDIPTIYKSLAERRRGVDPLSYVDIVIEFEKQLKQEQKQIADEKKKNSEK